MEMKIVQVGESLAMILPDDFVKAKKLKAGQKVFVQSDPECDLLQVGTEDKYYPALTPEFKQWLDRFMDDHDDVLRELAKR